MKINLKRMSAAALVGAVMLSGLGAAQAASADPIAGSPTITITPTTGTVDDNPMLTRLQTSVGCPAGYRDASGTFAFQDGVRKGSLSIARTADTPATDGATGLNGQPMDLNRDINPDNPGLSNKPLADIPLNVGDWEIRVYCIASFQQFSEANDKWITLPMTLDAAGTWAVKGAVVVVPAQSTTVSLTANLNAATKIAALSATVKDSANATATAAPGSVEFLEGTTVLGTGTVANGVATFSTAVLSTGSHTFTARYISSDAVGWANSPVSSGATVVVSPDAAAPGTTNVIVAIPTGTGALTYTGLQASIDLGTAVLSNGLFTASGNLGPIVVTDTRQLGSSAWSLTGQVTDFTDGAKSIAGKYLGWTPANVGTSNAGVAGAAVAPAPATVDGLKVARTLSSGSVVDGVQTTTTSAALNLAAPGNTPGGNYSATLTLTLI